MRPDHGRDAPVEVPAHRLLLRRRLGVHVDDDEGGRRPHPGHLLVRPDERAVDGGEEHAALNVEHADLIGPRLDDHRADARRARGVVGGAQEQVLLDDVLDDLLAVPDVVPRGHHVDAAVQEAAGQGRRHPEPGCRVLDVDDHEVSVELRPEAGQDGEQRAPPGLAEHVADADHRHRLQRLAPSRLRGGGRRPSEFTARTRPPGARGSP